MFLERLRMHNLKIENYVGRVGGRGDFFGIKENAGVRETKTFYNMTFPFDLIRHFKALVKEISAKLLTRITMLRCLRERLSHRGLSKLGVFEKGVQGESRLKPRVLLVLRVSIIQRLPGVPK